MPRHWSETVAKNHLLNGGYKLLAENYAIRGGEIDLIMQQGKVIVFIEVRQRKSARYGSAAASITAQKLARLRKTALHYLVTTFERDDLPVRFDAVFLNGTQEKYNVEHLENIF